MKNFLLKELSFKDFLNTYESTNFIDTSDKIKTEVTKILEEVRKSKDKSLIVFTKEFDGVKMASAKNFHYKKADFKKAYQCLDKKIISNLEFLKQRIMKFHSKKFLKSWKSKDTAFNEYGQIIRPIKRVGLYAPGGTATYPSSILMTSVLANVAGVQEILVSFPPSNKEITNLIREKSKADISPSQIILKDELNQIGLFKIEINFHSEVKANVSIKIDKIQSK